MPDAGSTKKVRKPKDPDDQPVSVFAATMARLVAAGVADDPAGAAALLLAQQMDARVDSGASLAAMTKQHGASLSEALGRSLRRNDVLDELRARRERRRA